MTKDNYICLDKLTHLYFSLKTTDMILVKETELLTLQQVAEWLGVSERTVYRIMSRGELKSTTVPAFKRRHFFKKKDVEKVSQLREAA